MLCNQWRRNVWIALELFIILSVMWYIVDFFSVMYLSGRTPEGFDTADTYKVTLSRMQPENPGFTLYEADSEEPARNFLRIVDRVRLHPAVETVSIGQWHYPYCEASTNNFFVNDTLKSLVNILTVTPDYFRVFRVKPDGGGDPEELAATLERGYIITRTVETELFGDASAIGQEIMKMPDSALYRIAGVATVMKQYAYTRPRPYIFFPFEEHTLMGKNERDILGRTDICFRIRPGAGGRDFVATFKEEMKAQLVTGNFFLADVTPVSVLRERMLKSRGVTETVQYRTGFTLFFLINAFLGVIGTFWLRVEKRRGEIGVRMAMGSSRRRVMTQMIAEGLLLATLALVPAVVVWFNLIAADVMAVDIVDFTWQRFLLNGILTVGLTDLAVALATWYPARRSARLHPADALHYE
jgi:putative ABC transport system permease protein